MADYPTLAVCTCAILLSAWAPSHAADRPNILLIVADDLGYSDLGCYGSEIKTPCLDRLAAGGLQFTRFRATPMCVTSRIALMAGMPMHRAGGQQYSSSLPLPKLLKRAGYRTLMTGKWHAGQPDPRSADLFDRAFGFLGGMTDSFAGGKDWFLDRDPFNDFGDGFYSTAAFADYSIHFMRESIERGEPFFMYVAFNAPHHPCQAPRETVERYGEVYQRGYEEIRAARLSALVEKGVISRVESTGVPGAEVRRWNELTEHRRSVEASRMAAYAATVDEVDQAVGRLLEFLDDQRIADNTLVIFLSDNGGDYGNGSLRDDESQIPWLAGSNPSSSNAWARVKCTPFRYYKHACHEGGLATPLIIRWPQGIQAHPGTQVDWPASITDLYPTLEQVAGAGSSSRTADPALHHTTGCSWLPVFQGETPVGRPPIFEWYTFSRLDRRRMESGSTVQRSLATL